MENPNIKSKFKKLLLVSLLIVGIAFVAIATVAPFLLPDPIYKVIYGWRYPKQWQAGDAMVKDAGPRQAVNRYTVFLADLQKTETTDLSLQLTSLPEVKLSLGFDIHMDSSETLIWDIKPVSALVHLRVENEKGELVIEQRAPLNQWVWSGKTNLKAKSFVYAQGKTIEIPAEADTFRVEPVDVKADGGWGTYFTPRQEGHYTVSLKIQGLNANSELDEFRLVAYGGGWK